MLCISAAYAVMRCPSICLSVHLSRSWIKTHKHIFEIFSPLGSHTILVFPYQTGWQYSDGNPPNGGVECMGYRQKSRFWSNSWLSKIAGRANYEVAKQLPTTMQCRSHSRRLTSECLFVTACSMDEYAEENGKECNCTQ